MGTTVEDMQLGCLWQGEQILSVSLSGHINYLDRNSNKPSRIIKGHNKPIMAMTTSADKSTIYTGSADGHICILGYINYHFFLVFLIHSMPNYH